MRRLFVLLLLAASAEAMPPPCPAMSPGANVFINFLGHVSACGPASGATCSVNEPFTFVAAGLYYNFGCAPHEFVWNFGDGATATGREVAHIFSTAGTFNVTLRISSPTQTVDVSQIVFVAWDPGPPFLALPLISGGRRVHGGFRFTIVAAIGMGEWIWDFGDGTSAGGTARTYEHIYAASGWYRVKLSSTDNFRVYDQSVFVPRLPSRRRSARH